MEGFVAGLIFGAAFCRVTATLSAEMKERKASLEESEKRRREVVERRWEDIVSASSGAARDHARYMIAGGFGDDVDWLVGVGDEDTK